MEQNILGGGFQMSRKSYQVSRWYADLQIYTSLLSLVYSRRRISGTYLSTWLILHLEIMGLAITSMSRKVPNALLKTRDLHAPGSWGDDGAMIETGVSTIQR